MLRTILISIAILILCAGAATAGNSSPRVVMVVAGNMSIRDIVASGLPNLTNLLESGSTALMNVRTGRSSKDIEPILRPGMEAGCVSIGAGTMAIGGAEARRAGNADGLVNGIPARVLYETRMGEDCGSAQVLHTEIIKMQRINQSASYSGRPGLLGSALRMFGIRTAVIGNSDIPGEMHREVVSIAMDAEGRVDYGDVDSPQLNLYVSDAPFGRQANYAAILSKYDQFAKNADFIVINFADTYRADAYAEFCMDEQAALIRHKAAVQLDSFIAQLAGKLDFKKDTLMLLSPNIRTFSDIDCERLSYVVIKGPGFKPGMLVSPSTHRAGVVTINDIAPTVIRILGAKQPLNMVGRCLESLPRSGVSEALLEMNMSASLQAQRQVAMRGSSVVQSIIVILVTLITLLVAVGSMRVIAAWIALVPVVLPLVMLYMPLFYSGGLIGAIIVLVVLTPLVLVASSLIFRSPLRAFVWLCGITVLSLIIDLLRGSPLAVLSIAGYSVTDGARYYGIGNELMGTLLGATVIGVGLMLAFGKTKAKLRGVIAAGIFGVVFIFIGSPSLGANLGGALAAAPAMVVALMARSSWKPNARSVAMILVITIVLIGALFAVDAMRNGASQTHVGRVANLAAGGDASSVLQVFERKIMLNFMLVSTSLWSRLLLVSLAGSALLYWWGTRRFGSVMLNKELAAAALGCCVGVVGAFIFNDSGVVAAATSAVFLWMLFSLRVLYLTDVKKAGE